ncbi:MAG: lysophospholipid acyltransferase family protein [Pseudomonadota bacterium]
MQTTPDIDTADITKRKAPRRSALPHAIALVRSFIYSVFATSWFILVTTLGVWTVLFPPRVVRLATTFWVRGDLFLLWLICGQRMRVIGRENIPKGPALVASKHQAEWETMSLLPLFDQGVVVIKKELTKIPIYGWYAKKLGMIPVDRASGAAALKQMAADARAAMDRGNQLIIFPEGTRRQVGAPPDYKPGALFLYEKLKVPLVPVALNSGLLWPRHRFVRYPGTITISVMPAISPGRPRADVKAQMIHAIETETDRLVAEATA